MTISPDNINNPAGSLMQTVVLSLFLYHNDNAIWQLVLMIGFCLWDTRGSLLSIIAHKRQNMSLSFYKMLHWINRIVLLSLELLAGELKYVVECTDRLTGIFV